MNAQRSSGIKPARVAALAAVFAGCLAVVKFIIFLKSGSLIVALSAFDSAIDVIVSFVNHRVIRFARLDADSDHPYGHGKAESIAALGQGALIAGAALTILTSSIQQLVTRGESDLHSYGSYWVAGFFLFAAGSSSLIAMLLKKYGLRFNSPALLGDSEHYRSDVFSNVGSAVAVSLILWLGYEWLDPAIAGVLAIVIAFNGFRLLRRTVDELMDHDVEPEIKEKALKLIADTNEKIIDVHRFRGRRSGHRLFFDFHITLPDNLNFVEIHSIADAVEDKLVAEFDADVTVHVDPESIPVSRHMALSRRKRRS